jgi:hypothetical protein
MSRSSRDMLGFRRISFWSGFRSAAWAWKLYHWSVCRNSRGMQLSGFDLINISELRPRTENCSSEAYRDARETYSLDRVCAQNSGGIIVSFTFCGDCIWLDWWRGWVPGKRGWPIPLRHLVASSEVRGLSLFRANHFWSQMLVISGIKPEKCLFARKSNQS